MHGLADQLRGLLWERGASHGGDEEGSGEPHPPFDQIVDNVRKLDDALDETRVQIYALWLADIGAARHPEYEAEATATRIN